MSGLNLKIECGSDEPFVVNSRMVDSVVTAPEVKLFGEHFHIHLKRKDFSIAL